jgi:hypothetical protein
MADERQQPSESPPEPCVWATWLSVASLILGILGIFSLGVTALFGLASGIAALARLGNETNPGRSRRAAMVGTTISAFMVMMIPYFVLSGMLFPSITGAREKARRSICEANVKEMGIAFLMYEQDYNDFFPPSATWNQAIIPYLKSPKLLLCPSSRFVDRALPGYAMNAKLGSMDGRCLYRPSDTVLLFETEPGVNRAGGRESLTHIPRHFDGENYCYSDGCVLWQHRQAMLYYTIAWEPSTGPPSED